MAELGTAVPWLSTQLSMAEPVPPPGPPAAPNHRRLRLTRT